MESTPKSVISTQPTPASFDFLTSVGQQMAAFSMNQTRPVMPLVTKFRYEPARTVKPIIQFPEADFSMPQKTTASQENISAFTSSNMQIVNPKQPNYEETNKSEVNKNKGEVKDGANGCQGDKSNGESAHFDSEKKLEKVQRELDCFKIENRALKEQLKLQSQVNSDLKKLLVASVGEDIEARVHFLTEDKVKLGNDIRRYVEQLTVDFETKETLSVQADLWRSKYLAANVLVDEVRQWKAALAKRCDQLQNCIRLLVDEHNKTRQMSLESHKKLSTLQKAFVVKPTHETLRSTNVLDIMQDNVAALNSVYQRLIGESVQPNGCVEREDFCPNTNGERLALNLLIAESYTHLEKLDGATSVLTGEPVSIAPESDLKFLKCCVVCSQTRNLI